jgi:hypothetical protein
MLTATIDLTKTPLELTVVSDKRVVSVQVSVLGETATATGKFPVKVTDSNRTWTLKTDDGKTAVYTA